MATKEELEALRKDLTRKVAEADERSEFAVKLARKMKITQEVQKYQDPGSKRGVAFIIENSYDLSDLKTAIDPLLDTDENKMATIKEGTSDEEKDAFIRFTVEYILRREKKDVKELEDYAMANQSRYGWATTKFFSQGDMFRGIDALADVPEELSVAEKVTRFRQAETQAKYLALDRAKSSRGGGGGYNDSGTGSYRSGGFSGNVAKRTRWDQQPDYSYPPPAATATSAMMNMSGQGVQGMQGQYNFIPGAAFMPPRAPVICFLCNEAGHMKRDCPKKKL